MLRTAQRKTSVKFFHVLFSQRENISIEHNKIMFKRFEGNSPLQISSNEQCTDARVFRSVPQHPRSLDRSLSVSKDTCRLIVETQSATSGLCIRMHHHQKAVNFQNASPIYFYCVNFYFFRKPCMESSIRMIIKET